MSMFTRNTPPPPHPHPSPSNGLHWRLLLLIAFYDYLKEENSIL